MASIPPNNGATPPPVAFLDSSNSNNSNGNGNGAIDGSGNEPTATAAVAPDAAQLSEVDATRTVAPQSAAVVTTAGGDDDAVAATTLATKALDEATASKVETPTIKEAGSEDAAPLVVTAGSDALATPSESSSGNNVLATPCPQKNEAMPVSDAILPSAQGEEDVAKETVKRNVIDHGEHRSDHVETRSESGAKRDIRYVTATVAGAPPVAKKLKMEETESTGSTNKIIVEGEAQDEEKAEKGKVNLEPVKQAISKTGKKDRKEFTAAEKLHILSLLDNHPPLVPMHQPDDGSADATTYNYEQTLHPQPMTMKQLRTKYGISKSSLHRWKQQKSRLQTLVSQDGLGDRKRDTKDLLIKVKNELKEFVEKNNQLGVEERLAITTPVIMTQVVRIQERLLEGYEIERKKNEEEELAKMEERAGNVPEPDCKVVVQADTSVLSNEEYDAIKSFKVTKGWAGRVARSMDLLSCPRPRKKQKTVKHEKTDGEGQAGRQSPVLWSSTNQAKQNTANFLNQTNPPLTIPKPRKDRREFSALDKLEILKQMEPPTSLKMHEICEKYHTSKSSVFRWKIQYKSGQLQKMVNDKGRGHCKRVHEDKLVKIKLELKKFIEENCLTTRAPLEDVALAVEGQDHDNIGPDQAMFLGAQIPLNGSVLQQQAQLARATLLQQHEADHTKGILTDEEEVAIRNFKASKGWARKAVAQYGWRVTGGTVIDIDHQDQLIDYVKMAQENHFAVGKSDREVTNNDISSAIGGDEEREGESMMHLEPPALPPDAAAAVFDQALGIGEVPNHPLHHTAPNENHAGENNGALLVKLAASQGANIVQNGISHDVAIEQQHEMMPAENTHNVLAEEANVSKDEGREVELIGDKQKHEETANNAGTEVVMASVLNETVDSVMETVVVTNADNASGHGDALATAHI